MTIASGVFTVLAAKKQASLGSAASGSGAQIYRRTTATLSKKKAFYKSSEIAPSMQRSDGRHGVVSVDGTINGELSVGTYS
ncbi:MAG TPA: phage tail tube protein, partial [Aquirhabdus sp.]